MPIVSHSHCDQPVQSIRLSSRQHVICQNHLMSILHTTPILKNKVSKLNQSTTDMLVWCCPTSVHSALTNKSQFYKQFQTMSIILPETLIRSSLAPPVLCNNATNRTIPRYVYHVHQNQRHSKVEVCYYYSCAKHHCKIVSHHAIVSKLHYSLLI